ncbi:MAG: ketol-acid reductoisomerase [Candidatus Nezhaarchaeales archaeon]
MARVWRDEDVSLEPLRDEVVAIIGYGNQGQAQAKNLRDSGVRVILGVRMDETRLQAERDGFEVYDIDKAAELGTIICFLIPDMVHAEVYEAYVRGRLRPGKALCFAHGASIHWGWVRPPSFVDVIMVAPKAPGQRVRELFLEGFGAPALVAVHQDYTGRAKQRALALAKGIGATRAAVIETTFKEEVETDWFGEQVDLCGGVDRLIRTAFEVLVEAGYQPEVAYFECLHELKLIVDLIQRYGIAGMYRRVSETARYGGLTRGGVVIGEGVKESMRRVLADVQSGRFAEEWLEAWRREGPEAFNKYMRELEEHPIERVGAELRKLIFREPGPTP